MTMRSLYEETITMVSCNDSPFWTLVPPGSLKPMMRAPSWLAALSKLKRVRVDGSKNRVATTLSDKIFCFGFFSNSSAMSNTSMYSSFEKSVMEMRLRPFNVLIMIGYLCLSFVCVYCHVLAGGLMAWVGFQSFLEVLQRAFMVVVYFFLKPTEVVQRVGAVGVDIKHLAV